MSFCSESLFSWMNQVHMLKRCMLVFTVVYCNKIENTFNINVVLVSYLYKSINWLTDWGINVQPKSLGLKSLNFYRDSLYNVGKHKERIFRNSTSKGIRRDSKFDTSIKTQPKLLDLKTWNFQHKFLI